MIRSIKYWIRCYLVIITWNLVSLIGFLSGAVIVAHILKHQFGVKGLWLQNDSKDGDFPPQWWLNKYDTGFKYLNAILWWFRNHSWNFINKFKQPSTSDNVIVIYPKGMTKKEYADKMEWSHRKGELYGTRYIKYIAEGKYCERFSHANKIFAFQTGSGGDRYKFLFTPIWPLLVIATVIALCILFL